MLNMFKLSNLQNRKKKKKRVARGDKTAGRGHKGQKSRSGGTKGPRFEGGQTPLYRRLPKKGGFKNYPFKKEYQVINLADLAKFENEVSFAGSPVPVKVLGDGELKKALKVTAAAFSKSAKDKIEKSGGQAVIC